LPTLRQAFSLREAFDGLGLALPELDPSEIGPQYAVLAKPVNDPVLTGLASLDSATPQTISFLSDRRYLKQARLSHAGVVLLTPALKAELASTSLAPSSSLKLALAQPYWVFAQLSQWIASRLEAERISKPRGISPTPYSPPPACHVDPTAIIGAKVRLAPGVVIGAGSEIGEGSIIEAHCVIGRDCKLGRNTHLYPHVVIYDDCSLGDRAIIHSGTVIGADGFGFAKSPEGWSKIAQLGAVRIGQDVEVGSNCSIDRGTLDDTVIEEGCKLDNLIQIAHNVHLGAHSVLAACVGVAGSARIGQRCMIGGSVGILGHLSIADDVTITPMSLVMSSIGQPGVYSGSSPLQAHRDWEKSAAIQRSLPDLRSRLRALEALNKNKQETL
jgi:UDP-3-O-[3-hydroxymyristoyl] glucosamine N-acyltransferase